MKVDPNAPAYPTVQFFGANPIPPATWPGIPIRLAIAAQIMAAQCANGFVPYSKDNRSEHSPQFRAERSLEWADALIAAHNEEK